LALKGFAVCILAPQRREIYELANAFPLLCKVCELLRGAKWGVEERAARNPCLILQLNCYGIFFQDKYIDAQKLEQDPNFGFHCEFINSDLQLDDDLTTISDFSPWNETRECTQEESKINQCLSTTNE